MLSSFLSEVVYLMRLSFLGSGNALGLVFDAAKAVPSLEDKVVLVTGGAGGLGRECALELARHGKPKRVYILDLPRDDDGREVTKEISDAAPGVDVCFVGVDLGSFASIQAAAARCTEQDERLDIAVLNAGILSTKPGITVEGYEKHFGINYLGHALLLKLLTPTLEHTATLPGARVRVVVVSSEGHALTPRGHILFDRLKTPCEDLVSGRGEWPWPTTVSVGPLIMSITNRFHHQHYFERYGQSKLCCLLLARELARKYPSFLTASVHPGRVPTALAAGLARESLLIRLGSPLGSLVTTSVAMGVRNHLWAVTSLDVVSGQYYEPVGLGGRESAAAKDGNLSRKLWAWTEKELEPWA